jgi:hypothetical protein
VSLVFVSGDHVWWYCPGCKNPHGVPFSGPNGWQFNGDTAKPTLSPSVLCHPHGDKLRCHCFMRDGRLEFCGDSAHDLAGQTVDMTPWDGWS